MADGPTRVHAPAAGRSAALRGPNPLPRVQRSCSCGGTCSSCQTRRRGELRRSALSSLQAKLTLGPAHDRYEREADRVASAIARVPSGGPAAPPLPSISKLPTEHRSAQVRNAPSSTGHAAPGGSDAGLAHRGRSADALTLASRVIGSPGRPLPTATLHRMSRRFGHDFSQVRVHCDAAAADSARALDARAYTVARDVVFGPGEFAPESNRGRALLAHELTHVVQQGGALSVRPRTFQSRSVLAEVLA